MIKKFEPYQARNVLYRFEDIDDFFHAQYSLNPYRGCSIGCGYCYVQEKKHQDSTSLEEKKQRLVQIKINAPYLLKNKLASGIEPALIIIGESCEPYSDIEDKYFITRRILEILKDYRFPVHIMTRFNRVLRDMDLIKEIHEKNFACITISIPVVSRDLSDKLDGGSPSVKERLKTLRSIRNNNIPAGVALAPVIPYISDGEEVNRVLRKSSDYGASYILCEFLKIKTYQREMFFSWLKDTYPRLVESYQRLYGEEESPQEDYRNKFLQMVKRKAGDLGLSLGLSQNFQSSSNYQQDLFKIDV